MFCRTCDYPLWNLATRQCPECGSAFKPSDFDFRPESICFQCPHCAQKYYGTDQRGHLTPASFDCVSCGHAIHMDEMLLTPAGGVEERSTIRTDFPWHHRDRHGFLRSWNKTILMSLLNPTAVGICMRSPGKTSAALGFSLLTNSLYLLTGLSPFLLMFVLGVQSGGGWIAAFISTAVITGMSIAYLAVSLFLWSGVTHLILRFTGGAPSGYGCTLRCFSYSSAANVLMAVPCLGTSLFMFSWIWWAISGIVMIHRAQRISVVRAAISVLVPPVIVILIAVIVFMWAIVPGMMQAPSRAMAAIQAAQATSLPGALMRYHGINGRFPAHAVELLSDGFIQPSTLYPDGNMHTELISGVNLFYLDTLSPNQRQQTVSTILAAMPPDVVAHRVGNIVFTYHGVEPSSHPPVLWLAVILPSSINTSSQHGQVTVTSNSPFSIDTYAVIQLDGRFITYPSIDFDAMLRGQNELRAKHGLPVLPDPAQVSANSPARAASK